ncbi:protein kinase domain-containing protein [Talaromyces stipitatus ATCC 10500]|uniref:Protein kinase domain-containing protein n=1 Tax=Talaromyces stipitatus (strain ATCC 10500 / CBS 375.48 / QM 6759 / NRRL 1006) TaxID=441959 RepID=B8MTC7_TALSN|nr:protein kinase domain-containing protein [Talaromyces stipitatus ATCC 10500]EED12377.1 protein kinase domain-containing protein [Talaromyces stipitatus ATCC 10500]
MKSIAPLSPLDMPVRTISPLAVDTLQNTPRRKTLSTPPDTPITDSDIESPTLNSHGSAIIEFPYDLDIARDSNGKYIEFGRGVWSTVYKATLSTTVAAKPVMVTPPSSPVTKSTSSSRIMAVKTPLRRDAHAVLKREAYILSRIMKDTVGEDVAVPFYGYIPSSHSLVLEACPLSLSAHIESCADSARKSFSTKTMFEPVTPHWSDLAKRLIKGLDWLHGSVGVVHGDIKPHNILLRPSHSSEGNEMEYDALYADFSSAHLMSSPSSPTNTTAEAITEDPGAAGASAALTPPFAAPELLTLSAIKSPTTLSTPSSDIFALALTLLAAATGDVLVYPGTSEMQRLAMSREGWRALDYVSSGSNASRLGGRHGLVRRVVEKGVAREPERRVGAGEWLDLLD